MSLSLKLAPAAGGTGVWGITGVFQRPHSCSKCIGSSLRNLEAHLTHGSCSIIITWQYFTGTQWAVHVHCSNDHLPLHDASKLASLFCRYLTPRMRTQPGSTFFNCSVFGSDTDAQFILQWSQRPYMAFGSPNQNQQLRANTFVEILAQHLYVCNPQPSQYFHTVTALSLDHIINVQYKYCSCGQP